MGLPERNEDRLHALASRLPMPSLNCSTDFSSSSSMVSSVRCRALGRMLCPSAPRSNLVHCRFQIRHHADAVDCGIVRWRVEGAGEYHSHRIRIERPATSPCDALERDRTTRDDRAGARCAAKARVSSQRIQAKVRSHCGGRSHDAFSPRMTIHAIAEARERHSRAIKQSMPRLP
jgi:hypothetical protein